MELKQFALEHFGMSENEFVEVFVNQILDEVRVELGGKPKQTPATQPPPPKATNTTNYKRPFPRYTTITFGDDFTNEMKRASGWDVVEIITDNRAKTDDELRDKPILPSPLTEPIEIIYTNEPSGAKKRKKHKLTVDFVERLANGIERIWIKTDPKDPRPPINYVGTIEFKNVKHITLTDDANEKWLRARYSTVFYNEDFLHINGESIGEENEEEPVYAGVITIKLQGDTKLKVAKRVNMFGGLGEELRESVNTNFSNAVKQYGIVGAEIWASPSQPSEKDAKDLKREIVGGLRERGIELYNNEPVKDTKEATVDVFACANGYKWRVNQEDDWNTQPSKNLKGDMPETYARNGGKENGMYFKIY